VLEYTVKHRVTDLKPFQFAEALGGVDPIVLDRFRISAPKAWQLEWVVRRYGQRISDLEPQIADDGAERRVWTWEARNTPPHPREQLGVDASLELPLIIARLTRWEDQGKPEVAFQSPKELSAWLFEKTQMLSAPDEAMRATVKQVLEGAPDDPREKARRLYEYTCRTVQYCAIEIGYGGWFPHPATAVQQNGFGDCKDKSNYLKGLLDLAGVKSRPTMIYAHSGYPLPFGLPSLAANFNHQILTIDLPDGPLLADPTSRTVAFGDLPAGDREAEVLPIQAGGADLTTAPPAVAEEHTETERFTLAVGDDGFGRGAFELEASGALAASLRHRLIVSVPSKRREVLNEWLDLHEAQVTAIEEPRGLELVPALSVKGRLDAPRLLLGEGQARLVRLSAFAPQWLPTLDDGARRTPLVLMTRYQKSGEVTLELPASLSVKRAPAPFSRTSKWLDYHLAYQTQGRSLIARRTLTLKERIVPPEELPALRGVLEAVHLAENAPVLLAAP
jgi:hypothetical protein